jgi:hypothetical protein
MVSSKDWRFLVKTRFIVSAVTAGALALGSMSSFAASGLPSTWQGVAPSEPQPGQTQITNPHPQYEGQWQGQQWQRNQQVERSQQWQRNQQVQRNRQWQRGHDARRDHERREHRDHDRRDYGYVYQQPGYAYQEPGYVYQQPAYVYQQGYAQPYYDGYYDNSDAGTNLVVGTILGGIIGSARANSR